MFTSYKASWCKVVSVEIIRTQSSASLSLRSPTVTDANVAVANICCTRIAATEEKLVTVPLHI